jgi:tungstate transport system substrate-binding protein
VKNLNRTIIIWITITIIAIVASVAGTAYYYTVTMKGRRRLIVSTTTSLYDTGLLDVIEEKFEEKNPIDLSFISVGTGLAIKYAKRGDADVVLVHAPSTEYAFLKEGYGVCRKIIAYNFFLIIGPKEDPAKIRNLNVTQSLTRIVKAGRNGSVVWVSRGDDSGTHVKEKTLWDSVGFNWTFLREEGWFMESGSGMGKTLLMAEERNAYTLADMGTYLKYRNGRHITLEALVSEEKELLNVYSVIAVNPEKVPTVNFQDAITFIRFLISPECQKLIGEFMKDFYKQSLFNPAVEILKQEDSSIVKWIQEYAFFNGTECPSNYQNGHPELYE